MELKDVILSTIAEIDDLSEQLTEEKTHSLEEVQETPQHDSDKSDTLVQEESNDSEKRFLEALQERLLVLFEGFQSPNNVHIEAKVDLTLNFLEYLLATVEKRLKNIDIKEVQ
jgi:hypothetical protein